MLQGLLLVVRVSVIRIRLFRIRHDALRIQQILVLTQAHAHVVDDVARRIIESVHAVEAHLYGQLKILSDAGDRCVCRVMDEGVHIRIDVGRLCLHRLYEGQCRRQERQHHRAAQKTPQDLMLLYLKMLHDFIPLYIHRT